LIKHVVKKGVEFDFVSLDRAYAVPEMFEFFQEQQAPNFIMRIARNRIVEFPDGTRTQLQKYLKLKRNERAKTIQAKLYGVIYFFTAFKRRKKRCDDWETVFLVSSMNLPAKEQVAAYDLRWPVEKMNRTTKQKFGTAQCQATQAIKQRAHIMAAFLAYSILGLLKIDNKSQSVNELVNIIRTSHFDDLINSMKKPKRIRELLKLDPIARSIQKTTHALLNNHDAIECFMH
jgi:hypothetical protein